MRNTALLLLAIAGIGYLIHLTRRTLMNQEQLATALEGVATQLAKATQEIVDAVAEQGNTTPRVDAAVTALQAASAALDALNPDKTAAAGKRKG